MPIKHIDDRPKMMNGMLTQKYKIDENERHLQLILYQIGSDDFQNLKQLNALLKPNFEKIMQKVTQGEKNLPGSKGIEEEKNYFIKFTTIYLETLLQANFDERYFTIRIAIGEKYGLSRWETQLFAARVNLLYQTLQVELNRKLVLKPYRRIKIFLTLSKVLSLDFDLLLQGYKETFYRTQLNPTIQNAIEFSKKTHHYLDQAQDSSVVIAKSINQLVQVSEQVATASTRQAEESQKVHFSALELSKSSAEMNDEAVLQSLAIQESNKMIKEIQSKIVEVSNQSNMREIIHHQVDAYVQIQETVKEGYSKVQEMEKNSSEIEKIIQTIEDIAHQTNLLALNAAIEAARAGEHGRGFSIVAEEVRKLAELASGSTAEIIQLLQSLQSGSHSAMNAMEKTIADFKEVSKSNESIANVFESLLSIAKEMAMLNENVSSSIEKVHGLTEKNLDHIKRIQKESDQIQHAIEHIAILAEENSASTEEVSASIQSMDQQMSNLVEDVQYLNQQNNERDKGIVVVTEKLFGKEESERISKIVMDHIAA